MKWRGSIPVVACTRALASISRVSDERRCPRKRRVKFLVILDGVLAVELSGGAVAREEARLTVFEQVADEAVGRQVHAAQPHWDAQPFEPLGLELPHAIGLPVAGGEPLEFETQRGMDERERAAEQHGHGGVLGGKPPLRLAQHQVDQLEEGLPFVRAEIGDEIDEATQALVDDAADCESRTGNRAPLEFTDDSMVFSPRAGSTLSSAPSGSPLGS